MVGDYNIGKNNTPVAFSNVDKEVLDMNESQDLGYQISNTLVYISETMLVVSVKQKYGSEDSMNRDLMFLLITYHLVTQLQDSFGGLIGKY